MNVQQMEYLIAQSAAEVAEKELADAEKRYIAEHGIINQDGTVPDRMYQIEDEDVFERACEGFDMVAERDGLFKRWQKSREDLKSAEDALLEYGLAIVPAAVSKVLREPSAKNYRVREKMIDLVLRLDAATVVQ